MKGIKKNEKSKINILQTKKLAKSVVKIGATASAAYIGYQLARNPLIQNMASNTKRKLINKFLILKKIIGDVFENEYETISILGSGSFGSAVLAINKKSNQLVVIKQIKDITSLNGQILVRNELDVLQRLSKLGCKYTCCYINHKYYNDNIFIIYSHDYVDTLKVMIKEKSIGDSKKSIVIDNLLKGLDFIHSNNIAHLDIKLDNIIVNVNTGDVKYIDFGIACNKSCILKTGGTQPFMSPELFDPVLPYAKEVYPIKLAKKADIWSLGVCIYIIVYGKHPYFSHIYNNPSHNEVDMLSNEDFKIEYNDSLYPEYNEIIRQMLVFDPLKRKIPGLLTKTKFWNWF